MKTIAAIVLSLAATAALAAPLPDYSGKWTLDLAASKDLPQRMYAGVASQTLTLKQTDKQVSFDIDIQRKDDAPAFKQTLTFNLDGTPTETSSKVRTPNGEVTVPMTLTLKPAADGTLNVTEVRHLSMGEQKFEAETSEQWQLSADGKTLTVHRTDKMRRGTMSFDMVFRRA